LLVKNPLTRFETTAHAGTCGRRGTMAKKKDKKDKKKDKKGKKKGKK
jgi:hypothetical protein